MTNQEWILEKMKNDKEFLAGFLAEYNPSCEGGYDWIGRWANPFNRRYEKREIGCITEIDEVFYDDYYDCEKDIIEWLDAEHKEDVEE